MFGKKKKEDEKKEEKKKEEKKAAEAKVEEKTPTKVSSPFPSTANASNDRPKDSFTRSAVAQDVGSAFRKSIHKKPDGKPESSVRIYSRHAYAAVHPTFEILI
jgi:hypothetical protein